MKSEKKTEIKVGLTVFFAILLFVLVYGWAKNYDLNSEHQILQVNFPTVAGLELGDLVSVNGVRKGLVHEILSEANSALVKIKFSETVDLREDAKFSIMMLDLMGGKKIEINSGISTNKIDYNTLHKGNFSGDISTAMATLSSVENDLVDVIKELKESLVNVNKLFGDNEFIKNVNYSTNNLRELSENLNDLISKNKDEISSTISNTKNISKKANLFWDENNKKVESILTGIDSTLSNTNLLVSNLSEITQEVKNSENNIGKLIYDEEFLSDLQQSLKQIKEMTTIINEQLKSGGLEVKADVDLF